MLRGERGMGTYGAVQIPPTRGHGTGGAWVFHALLLLWGAGAPDQERLRRWGRGVRESYSFIPIM